MAHQGDLEAAAIIVEINFVKASSSRPHWINHLTYRQLSK
jgi:hypothetical protein